MILLHTWSRDKCINHLMGTTGIVRPFLTDSTLCRKEANGPIL